MSRQSLAFLLVFLLSVAPLYAPPLQQRYERVLIGPATSRQTMKPVVRGAQYAAASMATQATMAAERILRAGATRLMPLLPARRRWRWWMLLRTASAVTPSC